MENRILLDTNALLRYLLRDDETQYQMVTGIASSYDCVVLGNVLQETVYVLEGFYRVSRDVIREKIDAVLDFFIFPDKEIISSAMEYYCRSPKLDYVDCLLLAYYSCEGIDFFSFDKKLNKVKDSL